MSPNDKDKISRKLSKLKEYIGYLKKIKKETKGQQHFLDNFELFGSGERYIQLSIQSILDITHIFLIESEFNRPEDNYKAVDLLVKEDVLTKELGSKLKKMIGLRNVLVHEYGDIDRKKIYKIIESDLSDLDEIKDSFIDFLSSE